MVLAVPIFSEGFDMGLQSVSYQVVTTCTNLLERIANNAKFHCAAPGSGLDTVTDFFDQVGHETMYAASGNKTFLH